MINLLSALLRDRTAEQGRGEAGEGEGLEEEEGQLDGDSWVTTTPPQVSITATTAAELCNYAQWTGAGNEPSRSWTLEVSQSQRRPLHY